MLSSMYLVFDAMYRTRNTIYHISEDREDNSTHSGVILTNFVVFGNVVKHPLEYLR